MGPTVHSPGSLAAPLPLQVSGAALPGRAPMHPGRFLDRHYLKPLAISQSEAARRLGVSRRRIHELVHALRAMSPDTAIRCALAFGLPASEWLAMQAAWDGHQAWRSLAHARRALRAA